jgi:hypothetical protein
MWWQSGQAVSVPSTQARKVRISCSPVLRFHFEHETREERGKSESGRI